MPGGYDQRAPRRNTYIIGNRQPGTVAPTAGLRSRRADENRNRPGGDRGRGTSFPHHRLAGGDSDPNKDWQNWTEALPVEDIDGGEDKRKPVTRPRPGHADLAGAIKYNFHDARYVLERASARETTARVAVGAIAKALLGEFGIQVLSHAIAVGPVRLERAAEWDELVELSRRDEVLLGCVDAATELRMKEVVDLAYRTGDTVGGVF